MTIFYFWKEIIHEHTLTLEAHKDFYHDFLENRLDMRSIFVQDPQISTNPKDDA